MASKHKIPINRFRDASAIFVGNDGQIYMPMSGELGLKFARVFRPTSAQLRRMILEIRRKKQFSRSGLAAILGVPKHTLRRWEDGSRKPNSAARRLIFFLHAFFFSPEQFSNLTNIVMWGSGAKAVIEIER